jgi:hypothetical protein
MTCLIVVFKQEVVAYVGGFFTRLHCMGEDSSYWQDILHVTSLPGTSTLPYVRVLPSLVQEPIRLWIKFFTRSGGWSRESLS